MMFATSAQNVREEMSGKTDSKDALAGFDNLLETKNIRQRSRIFFGLAVQFQST